MTAAAHRPEPAVTPGDWRLFGGRVIIKVEAAGYAEPPDPPQEPWYLAGAMAFANAALPGNDPHKFTRADVRYLDGAIEFVELAGGNPDVLRTIRDRLDALLPPE